MGTTLKYLIAHPPVMVAVIGVTGVLLTAWTSIGLWWLNQRSSRVARDRDRREKERDYLRALAAEIKVNASRFKGVPLAHHRDMVVAKIRAGGVAPTLDYTPFVPRFASSLVFDHVLKEIHILPTSLVDEVVDYYKLERFVSDLVEDIRSATYAGLDAERKAQVYSDYIDVLDETLAKGSKLEVRLAKIFEAGKISSRASANAASTSPM